MIWLLLILCLAVLILIWYLSTKQKSKNNLVLERKSDYLTICDNSKPYNEPVLYKDFLSHEECKLLIKLALEKGLEASKVMDDKKSETRTSQTCWLSDGDHPFLYQFFVRVQDLLGVQKSNFEQLQVVKYKPNGYFRGHYDQCLINEDYCKEELKKFGGKPRDKTFMIYLNDPNSYQGGETSFQVLGKSFKESIGTALLFENLDATKQYVHPKAYHQGSDVLSGEKWICNLWIRS
jgi:prolyl 4-hydroxylase